jgi:hypothetical protein
MQFNIQLLIDLYSSSISYVRFSGILCNFARGRIVSVRDSHSTTRDKQLVIMCHFQKMTNIPSGIMLILLKEEMAVCSLHVLMPFLEQMWKDVVGGAAV